MNWLTDQGLWAFINFAILVWLIVRFGGKPIAKLFRNRAEEIARAVAAAERALHEAQETLDQATEIRRAEHGILENVGAGARTLAASLAADVDREAIADADHIRAAARAEIDRERHALLSELRVTLLRDAFDQAERRIREGLTPEAHRALFADFARRAGEVQP